jgi:peptidoglycan/xylan/chitin deacetylase (PgdA/CDA1 family)
LATRRVRSLTQHLTEQRPGCAPSENGYPSFGGRRGVSSILMYHGVRNTPRHRYDVRIDDFERQLNLLSSTPVISIEALISGSSGVALTFDDGDVTCLAEVAPRLAQRNWPAVAYITTGYLNRIGYLRTAELRHLAKGGILIGAHGHTHRPLNLLSDAELWDELVRSKSVLEHALGFSVRHMALPGGAGSLRVTAAARSVGFESVATSWPATVGKRCDCYRLPRAAIRADMTEAEFQLILAHSLRFYLRARAHVRATNLTRRLVGASAYQALQKARRLVRG